MKHIFLLILVVILTGCTTIKPRVQKVTQNATVVHNEAYEKEITTQAQAFFEEHPEYMNSEEMETQLYALYQKVLNDPKNQGLSLYQILIVTHSQLMVSR